jgi:DNA invertase Pin-like site-specific DNA recombinase
MSTETTKPRCAIMVRGTEEERNRQIEDLRFTIATNGWEEVSLIQEHEGSDVAIARALELAKNNMIDKLLIHNISRIARKCSDAHMLLENLVDYGVSLYWHSQGLETLLENGMRNPGASMMLTLSFAAEIECEELASQPYWCDNVDLAPVQKVKKAISYV